MDTVVEFLLELFGELILPALWQVTPRWLGWTLLAGFVGCVAWQVWSAL